MHRYETIVLCISCAQDFLNFAQDNNTEYLYSLEAESMRTNQIANYHACIHRFIGTGPVAPPPQRILKCVLKTFIFHKTYTLNFVALLCSVINSIYAPPFNMKSWIPEGFEKSHMRNANINFYWFLSFSEGLKNSITMDSYPL